MGELWSRMCAEAEAERLRWCDAHERVTSASQPCPGCALSMAECERAGWVRWLITTGKLQPGRD